MLLIGITQIRAYDRNVAHSHKRFDVSIISVTVLTSKMYVGICESGGIPHLFVAVTLRIISLLFVTQCMLRQMSKIET